MLAPVRLLGCLICVSREKIIEVRVPVLLQLHAMPARMLLHKSTWGYSSRWGSFLRVEGWLQCFRDLMQVLLEAANWRCAPLYERVAPLYVIQGVWCAVNAELRLEPIAADSRRICIVSILLHSDLPSGDLRFSFLQNGVCWLVWCRTWPMRILSVNIRIKPRWKTANDDPRSINVLGVFLCMKGCSVLSSFLSPFMVILVVGVWRWN